MGSPGDDSEWRRRRTQNAEHQHRELMRRRAAETARARALLAEFVATATNSGPPPEPLRARSRHGGGSYRTGLTGWYLRRNQSVAVSTEGRFYVLSVPGGLGTRLRGARPEPSDPPLVLGAGGRDGESIDLADALRAVLDRT